MQRCFTDSIIAQLTYITNSNLLLSAKNVSHIWITSRNNVIINKFGNLRGSPGSKNSCDKSKVIHLKPKNWGSISFLTYTHNKNMLLNALLSSSHMQTQTRTCTRTHTHIPHTKLLYSAKSLRWSNFIIWSSVLSKHK